MELIISDEKTKELLTEVIIKMIKEKMGTALEALGNAGWEHAGPLAPNGMNAQFVAFKRPK